MRDALDVSFAWAGVDPGQLATLGLDILVYTGPARPEQWWVDACRAAGVIVTFIQETYSARAQEGWNAGIADAQYADARATERGHPLTSTVAYVVSDGSRWNPASGAEGIAAYGAAVATQSARPVLFYGNRYAVDAAQAGALGVPVNVYGNRPAVFSAWLPRTWDFDPARDAIAQEPNLPTPIDGTDFNTVVREYRGTNITPTPPPTPEDLMEMFTFQQPDGTKSFNRVGVGVDGKLRQWAYVPGTGWVLDGVVLATGCAPAEFVEVMLPGNFDAATQLSVVMADGVSWGHGYWDPAGTFTFEVRAASDVGPAVVPPGLDAPSSGAPAGPLVDVDAVAQAVTTDVLAAYDGATNVNERATIEQAVDTAVRAHLP